MQGEGRLPGVREEDGPLGPYGAVKECPGVSTVPCTKDSSDPPSKPLCLTPVRPHPLPPAPSFACKITKEETVEKGKARSGEKHPLLVTSLWPRQSHLTQGRMLAGEPVCSTVSCSQMPWPARAPAR